MPDFRFESPDRGSEDLDIFDILAMIGGLCMFLLGMRLMSTNLEQCAGRKMSALLLKFAGTPIRGFLFGMMVTVVIQSSSATTAMVVGFVSAGMLTLQQSFGIVLGANVGTTITAWIISLSGIDSDVVWIRFLKPTSFTPVLALIGIVLVIFSKRRKRNEIGMVLLGFAVLMFGISAMSGAVSGLSESEGFASAMTAFTNPVLGVLVGTGLTAIIQSSSASVGILQALSVTGKITFGIAVPVILGQNFGACVTAMIASIGAPRDAKRAALIHLTFNLIFKTAVVLLFYLAVAVFALPILSQATSITDIALIHTLINLAAALLALPFSKPLIKLTGLVTRGKRGKNEDSPFRSLDDHMLTTPELALANCENVVKEMAEKAVDCMHKAIGILFSYDAQTAQKIREQEDLIDQYEDHAGSYLIKISAQPINEKAGAEAAMLLRLIGDFERISDHSVNLVESAEEIRDKNIKFSSDARKELAVLEQAVDDILALTLKSFLENSGEDAELVEPLEQVIDLCRERIRLNHTIRLQKSECTLEHGFVLSDILTNLERVSDHCSNIAGCILETRHDEMDMHRYLSAVRTQSETYQSAYAGYAEKYFIPASQAGTPAGVAEGKN